MPSFVIRDSTTRLYADRDGKWVSSLDEAHRFGSKKEAVVFGLERMMFQAELVVMEGETHAATDQVFSIHELARQEDTTDDPTQG